MKLEIKKESNESMHSLREDSNPMQLLCLILNPDIPIFEEIVRRVNLHEELINGYKRILEALQPPGIININWLQDFVIGKLHNADSKPQGEGQTS